MHRHTHTYSLTYIKTHIRKHKYTQTLFTPKFLYSIHISYYSNHHNLQTITLWIAPTFQTSILWFKRNLWRTVQQQQSSIWDGMGPPTAQSYREVSLLWRRPQKISMEGKEVSTDYDDELGKVTRTTMLNLSSSFWREAYFLGFLESNANEHLLVFGGLGYCNVTCWDNKDNRGRMWF